jgi:hypothetical protein
MLFYTFFNHLESLPVESLSIYCSSLSLERESTYTHRVSVTMCLFKTLGRFGSFQLNGNEANRRNVLKYETKYNQAFHQKHLT